MTWLLRVIHWPARPGSLLVPWYVVLWRVVWAPLVYAGLALAFVGLLFGWGFNEAMRFWRNAL